MRPIGPGADDGVGVVVVDGFGHAKVGQLDIERVPRLDEYVVGGQVAVDQGLAAAAVDVAEAEGALVEELSALVVGEAPLSSLLPEVAEWDILEQQPVVGDLVGAYELDDMCLHTYVEVLAK